jgi:hypothetical protein
MAANRLNKTASKYDIKITTSKTKVIEMCERNIQREKYK